jgi:hypothetical protein
MSAPDFYFAVNAIFRHIHDRYGKAALVDYWRSLGREYYAGRSRRWREGGPAAIAGDWREYFAREPQAKVEVVVHEDAVMLDIRVCPAIKHLRDCGREIVPYYCEHCDHVCGAMAEAAGYGFDRRGGMGACQQRFSPVGVAVALPPRSQGAAVQLPRQRRSRAGEAD